MAKTTKPDEVEAAVSASADNSSRADEAQQILETKIDSYVLIYDAISKKVSSEHVIAAIFSAIVAEK